MKTLTEIGFNSTTIKSLFMIWGFVFLILSVLCIAFYFLKASGLYKMAKRQKIRKSEYAFIPFLNCVLIDNLALSCDEKAKTGASIKKTLLISKVISVIFFFAFFIKAAFSLIDITFIADALMYNGKKVNYSDIKQILTVAIIIFALLIISLLVYFILLLKDLWKIYSAFSKNRVALIIFSIILPVFIPVFLFSIKDNNNFTAENETDNYYE